MQPRILAFSAALALAAAATPAFSVDKGFYLGGSLGQSESGIRNGNFNFKDRDQGYKLIAGIRPLSLLAVELNYVELGTATLGSAQAKTKAADGFALVFLPIPVVDVYGKLGYVSWKTDASAPTLSVHTSGSDLAYGAGVQVHFTGLSARLEYEAFDARAAARPTLLSLGLTYTFL
ncbi:MAG: outer membrane beta-barrel protein [Gammaproteobacteria bacterium]|nr:outer membrane beta-barrel protein [Gammaproteobacteria bacterium]MDE2251737.1 outer membrane beta-barrel protein [Gammaproteobacteria bacterium]